MRLGQIVINLTVGFHYSVQKGQVQTLGVKFGATEA